MGLRNIHGYLEAHFEGRVVTVRILPCCDSLPLRCLCVCHQERWGGGCGSSYLPAAPVSNYSSSSMLIFHYLVPPFPRLISTFCLSTSPGPCALLSRSLNPSSILFSSVFTREPVMLYYLCGWLPSPGTYLWTVSCFWDKDFKLILSPVSAFGI